MPKMQHGLLEFVFNPIEACSFQAKIRNDKYVFGAWKTESIFVESWAACLNAVLNIARPVPEANCPNAMTGCKDPVLGQELLLRIIS